MSTFRELIEKSEYQVYLVQDELWVAYGQGSGSTTQLRDIKKFITDDRNDKHYDSNVSKLIKYANSNKPIKTNKSKSDRAYEILEYPSVSMGRSYTSWGGDVKPIGKLYMVISIGKNTYVNFFKSKNEAVNWVNSVA